MDTIDLNLVRAFVTVHREASFSLAAEKLGVPRSTTSRAVSALEESLGVLLFHRTTRKVTTTQAGLALFDRVAPTLEALEGSLHQTLDEHEEPSGELRITTTADVGTIVLAEAVSRFTARYPKVSVDLQLTNRVVDLRREGFDLAVRVSPARRPDSALIVQKVGVMGFGLYASPSYVARRGAPRSPGDLAAHDFVAFRGAPPLRLSTAKLERLVATPPRVLCDDMFTSREILRTGGGIGALPTFVVDDDLADGRLVRILARWAPETGAVLLVSPSRKHVPARAVAFRQLLIEMLRQRPLTLDARRHVS